MEVLPQPRPAGSPALPQDRMPRGGKAIEESEFSNGLLILPPQGGKQREMANQNESFYVVSCEPNALLVTIHETPLELSKGDTFQVPTGNTYTLLNRSKTKEAKLYFTLVRPQLQFLKQILSQPDEVQNQLFDSIRRQLNSERGLDNEEKDAEEEPREPRSGSSRKQRS